eukprot:TRINITY_DN24324_c0_g1_i2.p1 TRINITY_DN24324_c0_g1~~TRINITY_DN24324_c0_g1_i2.p1  ORF type:complete len:223 (-),score=26.32 TRINITY_DN24324_c0_g1_i2:310-978(-)
MCIRDRSTWESNKKLHPMPQTITSHQDIRKVYKFSQKPIGHGHFGTVRIAMQIQNPDKKYAVKSILKSKIQKDFHLFQRELSILRQLDHPNIIKFYETYQDEKFFHLVMEYCKGGELFARIASMGHFSEIEAMKTMKALFLAVKYLHEQGICHRDLKPENLLYSDNTPSAQIKIIDFGLSRQFDLEKEFSQNLKQMNTMVGTALYVAPEVIAGTKYNSSCDN